MPILSRRRITELSAEILEVDVDADKETVEGAYREKVFLYHPDISDDPDPSMFTAIGDARDVLVTPGYPDSETDRRNVSGHLIAAMDVDVDEEPGPTVDIDMESPEELHLRFNISVFTDVVLSEIDIIFTQPPDSEEVFEDIVAQVVSEGYGGQTFENITVREMAYILEPHTKDDIDVGIIESMLGDADMQIRDRFGQFTNMFSVSQVIGSLIAGGVIRPEDFGEQDDDGPWEYSSRSSESHWRRGGRDHGPWRR